MSSAAILTLDISEAQVLIDLFDDPNGYRWHHRVLLVATPAAGVWIASSPGFSVERLDLNAHRVRALGRHSRLPENEYSESYVFDSPIRDEDLRHIRTQAQELARVLGVTALGGTAPGVGASDGAWIVADPSAPSFGDELPLAISGDPSQFISPPEPGSEAYSSALALLDGAWTWCQCVPPGDRGEWMRSLVSSHGCDGRLLGDDRDRATGHRYFTFSESYGRFSVPTDPPFALSGQRAAFEYIRALRGSGMEWVGHHLDFVHKSGLSPMSGTCSSHRRVYEALQCSQQHDLLNLPGPHGCEVLVRYLIQIETAVARSPRSPDFQDLDAISATTVNEFGGLVLPEYSRFVARLQKDEAFTLKQQRQWREEQHVLGRNRGFGGGPAGSGAGGGSDDGDGGGRGRGRASAGRKGRSGGGRGWHWRGPGRPRLLMRPPQGRGGRRRSPGHRSPSPAPPRPTSTGGIRGPAAEGRPHTMVDRPHGDPFPLPHLPVGRRDPLVAGLSRGSRRRCNAAVDVLNALDLPSTALAPCWSALPPNAAQASILERVVRRVSAYGLPPAMDGDDALRSLVKAKDIDSARKAPVATLRPELFCVLDSGIRPKDIRTVLPAPHLHLVEEPERYIYRSDRVMEAMVDRGDIEVVYPYWDISLRHSRPKSLALFRQLLDIGLVGLRVRRRSRASIFFVKKKDRTQRMVIDGRESSALHRRPPHTDLGSASAIASLDIGGLLHDGDDGVFGASADLKQCFYQLQWKQIASWFALDFPEELSVFPSHQVYDEGAREYVDLPDDTRVFVCFQGLPMGWSWSLHFANLIMEDVLVAGVKRGLGVGDDRIIRLSEGRPGGRLAPGSVAVASYLDNANIVGCNRLFVNQALQGVLDELTERSLDFHEVHEASSWFESGGVRFDFVHGEARPLSERCWKMYFGISAALDRGGLTPASMQIHLVYHFMMLRPALSVLNALYHYASSRSYAFKRFSVAEASELRQARDLLLLARVDIAAEWDQWAYCSDACLSGYSPSVGRFTTEELAEVVKFREKWRFKLSDPFEDDDGRVSDLAVAADAPSEVPGPRCAPRPRPLPHVVVERADVPIPQVPGSMVDPPCWHLVVKGGFLYSDSIHILEGRTVLLGLRRASRCVASHGKRVLSLCDNLTALLSLEKGRSQAYHLNLLAKQSAARQISSDIRHLFRLQGRREGRAPGGRNAARRAAGRVPTSLRRRCRRTAA